MTDDKAATRKRKPRSKFEVIRQERKQKRKDKQASDIEAKRTKRQRIEEPEKVGEHQHPGYDGRDDGMGHQAPELEYFGMLTEEEHEYFRRADELLSQDFQSADDPDMYRTPEQREKFLESVYRDAQGKELKLACSQSHSRLMERLILVSTTKQKKDLFGQFANHFLSLLQHRFASHCCETLFLHSAPIVTQELGGAADKNRSVDGDAAEQSMEDLFLLTLDELEANMSFLMTDKYASHSLRLLLLILSGRPLGDAKAKSLVQSKKKEHISVPGASTASSEQGQHLRAVPASFTVATKKIITDTTTSLNEAGLRILIQHPTGNPLLQLLLELDMALNLADKGKDPEADIRSLLYRLLPGAPQSLNDAASRASDFVNKHVFDQMGSRILETIVTNCPGKVFKSLQLNFFGPRIDAFLRNDIASYSVARALARYSKEDLVDAVGKILPVMSMLVEKGRFSVVKTLFERCEVRGATEELDSLTRALVDACGSVEAVVPKICYLNDNSEEEKNVPHQYRQNKSAMIAHGAHLANAMLSINGTPSATIQTSLSALPAAHLLKLATNSSPTVAILTTALATPSPTPGFHKALVADLLLPHLAKLCASPAGHNFVNAVIAVPSRGKTRAVPFHFKEEAVGQLAAMARELQDSWTGRSVWRTWKGDDWKYRRGEWLKWAKEADGPRDEAQGAKPWEEAKAARPWEKAGRGRGRGRGRR